MENAPNAVWKDGKWFMENGTIYDLGEDGISRTMRFKNQFIPYGQSPETIQKEHKDYDEMTIRELFTARKAYEAAHEDATAIIMEIHRRFSLPFFARFCLWSRRNASRRAARTIIIINRIWTFSSYYFCILCRNDIS